MAVTVRVTHPDRPPMIREFENRPKAAKFGVFFYLVDNGYADKRDATTTASIFQKSGNAEFGDFSFEEITYV